LNLFGFVIPLLVQLLTVPFYLELIGSERYGVMALIWLVLGYFGFFDLGFGQAMANRLASLPENAVHERQKVFWTGTCLSVTAGIAGGLVVMIVSHPIFTHFLSVPGSLTDEVRRSLPLLAVALPVVTAISAFSGALQGCEAFKPLNLGQTIGAVLYQVLPLAVAAVFSVSLPGLIAAAIAGRIVSAVLLLLACLRRFDRSLQPKLTVAEARALFGFGSWVTLGGILGPLFMLLDRMVIGSVLGMQAVTIYTVPYNFILRIGVLPSSLQNALFPRFASMPADNALALLKSSVFLVACLMTPILVIVILAIKPFLIFWIGNDLGTPAALVGQIVAIGFWFNAMSFVPFSYVQSRGRPDLPAKCHLLEMILYLPLLFLATQQFGVAGTAAVWSLRVFANMVLMFVAAGDSSQLVAIAPAIAPLLLSLGLVADNGFNTIFTGFGYAAVLALGMIWAVRNFPPEAAEFVPSSARRLISAARQRISVRVRSTT
jgi:O-antigen/teichoic acid export membrane protein